MPRPGSGSVDCHIVGGQLRQAVTSAYPLKIIAPCAGERPQSADYYPAVSYLMTYGGGIVHGDRIHVDVRVGTKCALVLLTQGSTKVFGPATADTSLQTSFQTIMADIAPDSLLCLLPDPVTCFQGALYNQRQCLTLQSLTTSSVVLLDWMTSGRMSRGERWAFSRYFSVNIITHPQGLLLRDALLLDDCQDTRFSRRLASVDAFALLLVLGPAVSSVAQVFRDEHHTQRIRAFHPSTEECEIAWSVSETDIIKGVAVRAAGPSTEALKDWIKCRLAPLRPIIGECAWSMYSNSF